MPLTLVTGPANSGKAGAVLGPLRARLGEDPILVVPAFADVAHSQRELARHGAIFGARVMRFKWLFEELARRVGTGDGASVASGLQRELIAEEAVRGAILVLMKPSSERPGFARRLTAFVAELERSMIEPERLERALLEWADEGRRRYAEEVAALYSGYRAALEAAGLTDEELFAWRALDALRTAPQVWGTTPVFVYGFDDFTPLELDLIETLATRADADVVVSLPFEAGRPAFKAIAGAHGGLDALADSREPRPGSDEHYADEARAPLHRLERRLFGGDGESPDPVEPAGAVRLLLAGGERAEVELVAAEVLQLLRSGTEAGEVAVVFRDPSGYGSLIEQIFGAYGIPFSIEREVPLGHTSLGRGLLALMRAAGPGGTADDLLTYLRMPGRLRIAGLADRLEARVRREQVTTAARARELWEASNFALDELDQLLPAGDVGTYVERLDARLERMFADPYRGTARTLTGAELDDARVFKAAREALAGIHALMSAGEGASIDHARVLDTLATLRVKLGENPQPDRVQVTDPKAVRARRFEAMFICGLQEGEFPRGARPEPFLPDDYRIEINADTRLGLPLRENQLDRERWLFYACASRASRMLVLSSRFSDEEGKRRAESFFVEDVRELFTDELDTARRLRTLAEVAWEPDEAPTLVEWERARAARGPREPEAVPDGLESPAAIEAAAGDGHCSAGAIESFADCPMKWLVEKRIKPKGLEPDSAAMLRGSFAHEVLERTLARIGEESGSKRVSAGGIGRAREILHEEIDRCTTEMTLAADDAGRDAELRRLRFDLVRMLEREAQAETAFEPEHLELGFGLGECPPLTLGRDDVQIVGKIDRVDTSDGRGIVRDYKSGATVPPATKWVEERQLQAAIYMLAVDEVLGLEPVGGVYAPLASKDPEPRGLLSEEHAGDIGNGYHEKDLRSTDDFKAILDWAREQAASVIEDIRTGRINPQPETCSRARDGGCRYPTICRVEG